MPFRGHSGRPDVTAASWLNSPWRRSASQSRHLSPLDPSTSHPGQLCRWEPGWRILLRPRSGRCGRPAAWTSTTRPVMTVVSQRVVGSRPV